MKNVLVVDDSRIMRNIVKNSFTAMKIGANFFEAANGEDAVAQLEEHDIDIIFLDWNMPKMSGIDFLKEVRKKEKYARLPIVMVTSEAARYNVIDALTEGATAYLVKPVSQEKFEKTILSLKF